MSKILLSILIPTLPKRAAMLNTLTIEIARQIGQRTDIEVIVDDRVNVTTGEKRNWLNNAATGEYVQHVDDDDMLFPWAIDAIATALKSKPDCVAINGIITTDGKNPQKFFHAIGLEYVTKNNQHFRPPNHLSPIKRELAQQIKFPDLTYMEDHAWCMAMQKAGLLKTQVIVDMPVYHYRYLSKKK